MSWGEKANGLENEGAEARPNPRPRHPRRWRARDLKNRPGGLCRPAGFALPGFIYARFHLCRTAGCGYTAARQGSSRERAAQQSGLPMQMIGRVLPRVQACGLMVGFEIGGASCGERVGQDGMISVCGGKL